MDRRSATVLIGWWGRKTKTPERHLLRRPRSAGSVGRPVTRGPGPRPTSRLPAARVLSPTPTPMPPLGSPRPFSRGERSRSGPQRHVSLGALPAGSWASVSSQISPFFLFRWRPSLKTFGLGPKNGICGSVLGRIATGPERQWVKAKRKPSWPRSRGAAASTLCSFTSARRAPGGPRGRGRGVAPSAAGARAGRGEPAGRPKTEVNPTALLLCNNTLI